MEGTKKQSFLFNYRNSHNSHIATATVKSPKISIHSTCTPAQPFTPPSTSHVPACHTPGTPPNDAPSVSQIIPSPSQLRLTTCRKPPTTAGRNGIFFAVAASASAFFALAYQRAQDEKKNVGEGNYHVRTERSGESNTSEQRVEGVGETADMWLFRWGSIRR